MDRAFDAGRLRFAIDASGQTLRGVAQQLLAVRAQLAPGMTMHVVTVDAHHGRHGGVLPVQAGGGRDRCGGRG